MNFVEQCVVSLDDPVLPQIPEAGEVFAEAHRTFVVEIGVISGRQVGYGLERSAPVCFEVGIDILRGMSGHGFERLGKLRILDMIDRDLEI